MEASVVRRVLCVLVVLASISAVGCVRLDTLGPIIVQPVHPPSSEPITELAVGQQHTCALHADRTVSCWGSNDWGQLGNDRAMSLAEAHYLGHQVQDRLQQELDITDVVVHVEPDELPVK